MTLEELARTLGGTIRRDVAQYLDTRIGTLRACVIRRAAPHSGLVTYDVAVLVPDVRELDPMHPHTDEWILADRTRIMPSLAQHGYVFAGCRGGVLHAVSLEPPSLEKTVGVLWELAEWARMPWRSITVADLDAWATARRRRRRRVIGRLAFVAAVTLLLYYLR